MGLIDDLARIRQMSGREPLPDPRVIQGFEPGTPPPPPYIPTERSQVPQEWLEPAPEPKSPPSPLVPRKAKPEPQEPPVDFPKFNMVIFDGLAAWKGRDVQLTQQEEGAIRAIILKAIQRELDGDLAIAARLSGDQPKKRGRPKKVKS